MVTPKFTMTGPHTPKAGVDVTEQIEALIKAVAELDDRNWNVADRKGQLTRPMETVRESLASVKKLYEAPPKSTLPTGTVRRS